ncbi:hypothetical protein JCM9533A_45430 [Catenuloplanes niger JCM 9533]
MIYNLFPNAPTADWQSTVFDTRPPGGRARRGGASVRCAGRPRAAGRPGSAGQVAGEVRAAEAVAGEAA